MSSPTKTYHRAFPIHQIWDRLPTTRSYRSETGSVLRKSIGEFGVVEPLLIDARHRVIHGQHLLEVARRLGLTRVPVLVVEGISDAEAASYHLMAGRLGEWHHWNPAETDRILAGLDGGLQTESVLGFEAPSERGKWRDLLREIGWFIDIIPAELSASTVDLEQLVVLMEDQLDSEHGKYQFDTDQLLFMETMRNQLNAVREEMVAKGLISPEDASRRTEDFDPKEELRYVAQRLKDKAEARLAKPEDLPTIADTYAMSQSRFLEWSQTL